MRSFTYERATDADAAIVAASKTGAKYISGGTNLLDLSEVARSNTRPISSISATWR